MWAGCYGVSRSTWRILRLPCELYNFVDTIFETFCDPPGHPIWLHGLQLEEPRYMLPFDPEIMLATRFEDLFGLAVSNDLSQPLECHMKHDFCFNWSFNMSKGRPDGVQEISGLLHTSFLNPYALQQGSNTIHSQSSTGFPRSNAASF